MPDESHTDNTDGEWIEVAKLGRAHGIKGEVRVFTQRPDWEGFEAGQELYLEQRHGSPEPMTIEQWRIADEFVIAKFESIDDRGEAEKLANRILSVPEERLSEPEEGEVYHYQIEGREVFVQPDDESETDEPERIGRVSGIFETGANDVMVVDLGDDELYVPMFEGAVESIEPDGDAVYLRPLSEWAPDGTDL